MFDHQEAHKRLRGYWSQLLAAMLDVGLSASLSHDLNPVVGRLLARHYRQVQALHVHADCAFLLSILQR